MEEFEVRDVAFVSDWLTKKVFKRSFLKTAGADDDCSLVGYDRQIRGHLKTILARGCGNLNDPIFKSLAGGWGGGEGGEDVEVSSGSSH